MPVLFVREKYVDQLAVYAADIVGLLMRQKEMSQALHAKIFVLVILYINDAIGVACETRMMRNKSFSHVDKRNLFKHTKACASLIQHEYHLVMNQEGRVMS